MRPILTALAFIALPIATAAQESAPEAESFRTLAALVPSDPNVTEQWTRLLPSIARQCGMTVDRERVRAIRREAPIRPSTDRDAHRLDDRLKATWAAMVARDVDDACRTADGLWGESGNAFPGVLRDRSESFFQTSPSLALAAAVPRSASSPVRHREELDRMPLKADNSTVSCRS